MPRFHLSLTFKETNMKIEIHLLQNVAPSCLNRDDTNTPKSCEFGGVSRARVSSQSWKRAVREFFREENSVTVGKRTKHVSGEIQKKLGDSFDTAKITAFVAAHYSKMDAKATRATETAVLVFISDAEIEAAADCLREELDMKAAAAKLQAARHSADIALFGRMLAEKPEGNVDAACQVAHAISTHAVNLETDFYTAVDDLSEEREETGAGMLGTQGFNSACFYRYALIDTVQLTRNLGGDKDLAAQTVEAFLRAFTLSIPGAKQNSHAAQNLPSFGLLVARESGIPVSLANAFAAPVYSADIISTSVAKLAGYHDKMQKVYGLYDGATQAVFHDRDAETAKSLGELKPDYDGSLSGAIGTIMRRVRGGQGAAA